MRILLALFCICVFSSCEDDAVVKPPAKLRLQYPTATFKRINTKCDYSFKINSNATFEVADNCAIKISYPLMKADIFLNYQDANSLNLNKLLFDAQKLVYNHKKVALNISEKVFVNPEKNVYGMFYEIDGQTASQAQFYVTDSINHFVNGALYFRAKPNFDSLYPSIQFIREDIRTIMETFEWEIINK